MLCIVILKKNPDISLLNRYMCFLYPTEPKCRLTLANWMMVGSAVLNGPDTLTIAKNKLLWFHYKVRIWMSNKINQSNQAWNNLTIWKPMLEFLLFDWLKYSVQLRLLTKTKPSYTLIQYLIRICTFFFTKTWSRTKFWSR